ncbi:hypothetical protein ncot_02415 [Nocardioides sp. JQ2195]|uniref:hypothetical protein n=1 Tax=Nocardioides sp. JQ2195 TaxID=2592334 RepID=UPI00143E828B|nr:hypothetical protein [Nocardioides sp. JQ2195]QIX25142.1 hypothetical protein ncot_02415 [Nocardioides sp. JQ2195]
MHQDVATLRELDQVLGLYYSNYTGSTSVLRGATFGRIAGAGAAAAAGSQLAGAGA